MYNMINPDVLFRGIVSKDSVLQEPLALLIATTEARMAHAPLTTLPSGDPSKVIALSIPSQGGEPAKLIQITDMNVRIKRRLWGKQVTPGPRRWTYIEGFVLNEHGSPVEKLETLLLTDVPSVTLRDLTYHTPEELETLTGNIQNGKRIGLRVYKNAQTQYQKTL